MPSRPHTQSWDTVSHEAFTKIRNDSIIIIGHLLDKFRFNTFDRLKKLDHILCFFTNGLLRVRALIAQCHTPPTIVRTWYTRTLTLVRR